MIRNPLYCGKLASELKKYEFNKKDGSELKDSISALINKKLENQIHERDLIQKQLTENLSKIEKLELRFVDGEINKELFDKYSSVYKSQTDELKEKLKGVSVTTSNLEKMIEKGLK